VKKTTVRGRAKDSREDEEKKNPEEGGAKKTPESVK